MPERASSSDWRTLQTPSTNLQVIRRSGAELPRDLKAARPEIPWVRVVGMRNALAHGFDVDLAIVWETVTRRLPPLRVAVRAMLDALREE